MGQHGEADVGSLDEGELGGSECLAKAVVRMGADRHVLDGGMVAQWGPVTLASESSPRTRTISETFTASPPYPC
jgi:hypothetical protein